MKEKYGAKIITQRIGKNQYYDFICKVEIPQKGKILVQEERHGPISRITFTERKYKGEKEVFLNRPEALVKLLKACEYRITVEGELWKINPLKALEFAEKFYDKISKEKYW